MKVKGSLNAQSAQKALQGPETETRELQGGTEEYVWISDVRLAVFTLNKRKDHKYIMAFGDLTCTLPRSAC